MDSVWAAAAAIEYDPLPGRFTCQADNGTNCTAYWTTFDYQHNTAAYFRDDFGIVHLKGMVKLVGNGGDAPGGARDNVNFIALLPEGYRPALREVQVDLQRPNVAGGVSIEADSQGLGGLIWTRTPVKDGQWVSLDGITFRCAPSGQDGCP